MTSDNTFLFFPFKKKNSSKEKKNISLKMELPTKYKIKNIQKLIQLLVWDLKEVSNNDFLVNFSIELINPSNLQIEGEIESDELKLEFFGSHPKNIYQQIKGLEFLSFDRDQFCDELPFFLNEPHPFKLMFHVSNFKVENVIRSQEDTSLETSGILTFISNRKNSPLFDFSCKQIDEGAVFAANLYYLISPKKNQYRTMETDQNIE